MLYPLAGKRTYAILALAAFVAEGRGAMPDCFDATCRVLVGEEPPATGCVFEVSDGKVFVLTNAHVVGTAQAVRCEFWSRGHKSLPLDGTVIARVRNDDCDAAIISLQEEQFGGRVPPAIRLAPRGYELTSGQTIISIGCSGGKWPTMFTGHSLTDPIDTVEFLPPPAGGRSGSAIFDADGTMIVGLLYAREEDGADVYGLACTLESLYKHLGESRLYQTTHTGGANCPNCPGGMCPMPPRPYLLPYRRQHEREHQGQAQGNPWPTLPRWQAAPAGPIPDAAPMELPDAPSPPSMPSRPTPYVGTPPVVSLPPSPGAAVIAELKKAIAAMNPPRPDAPDAPLWEGDGPGLPLPIPPRPNSSSALPADSVRGPAARSSPPVGSRIPWALILTALGSATGVGLPVWGVMALRTARTVRRILKEREAGGSPPPAPPSVERTIVVDSPPTPQTHRIDSQFVNVESDHYRRAHEMARQQLARKYPGSQDILEAEQSLIHQFMAGTPASTT